LILSQLCLNKSGGIEMNTIIQFDI